MTIARTVWFERPGIAAIRREPLRDPDAGQVRVRGLCSGIAAGLERLLLAGALPEPARAALPPGSTRGAWPLPIAFGAALVGVVEAVGPGVDGARIGERVLLAHPHQDVLVTEIAPLRRAPSTAPAARSTLAFSAEAAVAAIEDARIALGQRVVVLGLGALGLLVVRLARRAGAGAVTAIDPVASRAALARDLGAASAAADVTSAANDIAAADVLVDASGSAAALDALIERAGGDARVVVASFHGDPGASIALGKRLAAARLELVVSRGVDPSRRARARAIVAEALADDALDALVAAPVPMSEAPALFAALAAREPWDPPHRVIDLRG